MKTAVSATKSARLFHGTSIYCLASIIKSDALNNGAHWGKPGEPYGPRLTESPDVAASFTSYCAYWAEGGFVVLDRDALARDYELIRYEDKSYDGDTWGEELEIVPLTEAITPLSKYLISICVDPEFFEAALAPEEIEMALSEGGYPESWGDTAEEFVEAATAAFQALRNSPLLNADTSYEFPSNGNWNQQATNRAIP